tara:strand:+ start:1441 stop:2925 length:1485 start_codon:yes stop_codon:yes gene_type:complete
MKQYKKSLKLKKISSKRKKTKRGQRRQVRKRINTKRRRTKIKKNPMKGGMMCCARPREGSAGSTGSEGGPKRGQRRARASRSKRRGEPKATPTPHAPSSHLAKKKALLRPTLNFDMMHAELSHISLSSLKEKIEKLCDNLANRALTADPEIVGCGFWATKGKGNENADGGYEGLNSNFSELDDEVNDGVRVRGRKSDWSFMSPWNEIFDRLPGELNKRAKCSYYQNTDQSLFYKYLEQPFPKKFDDEQMEFIIIKTFMREYLMHKYVSMGGDDILSQKLFLATSRCVTPRILGCGISLGEYDENRFILKVIFKFQHVASLAQELKFSPELGAFCAADKSSPEEKKEVIEIEERLDNNLNCFHGDLLARVREGAPGEYISFDPKAGKFVLFNSYPDALLTSKDDMGTLVREVNFNNIFRLIEPKNLERSTSEPVTPLINPRRPELILLDFGSSINQKVFGGCLEWLRATVTKPAHPATGSGKLPEAQQIVNKNGG